GAGKRSPRTSAAQRGAVGVAACRGSCGAAAGGGSSLLDVAAALWNCGSRCAGAGGKPASVARTAYGVSAAGGSRRDSRRAICRWIFGRAVCVAGGGRVGAGFAQAGRGAGNDYDFGGRSAEPG